MLSLNQVKQEIEKTESIKLITQALGDIAALKLKTTRRSKEHNIIYFQEISRIYRIVKSIAYQQKGNKIYQNRSADKVKSNKTLCLLLSANSHFYGGLDSELTKFFEGNTIKLNCDRIVVGQSGKEFLNALAYPHSFESIIFKKDSPTQTELKLLSDKIFGYGKILVFHTKFVTILNQVPYISDISMSYLEPNSKIKLPFRYIAEPEIDKILDFFDSQISYLLFQAIFLEIDYSRLAARMISMNQAEENSQKVLDSENRALLNIRKQIQNIEILETFAGLVNKNKF